MSSIPSQQLVSVTPSVLAAGGAGVATIGLALTLNTRVPVGQVLSFPNAEAVQNFFGPGEEATGAGIYFAGFDTATQIPASLLFAQYPKAAVGAYLRSGNVFVALTLAQIQAISGSLNVTIDGYPRNAASVNLASATGFSSAASIIQTALNAADPTEASVTASIGGTFTGGISGTVMTISAVIGGVLSVGDTITGGGTSAGTKIVSFGSGTGGTGTYNVNNSQTVGSTTLTAASNVLDITAVLSGTPAPGQYTTGSGVTSAAILSQISGAADDVGTYLLAGSPQTVASETMTLTGVPVSVTFDSVSGGFLIASGITGSASGAAYATGTISASLLLTQATGAAVSPGSDAAVPATFMNSLVNINNDWVAFMTAFNPDGNTGLNTVKQAFAAWKNTQRNRFAYVCFDTDASPTLTVPASTSLGQILMANGDSGTCLVWEPSDQHIAWFVLGAIASINFGQTNGRITFAYKSQAGLTAGVTDPTVADNLAGNPQTAGSVGNGYNFYGAYATAGQSNIWFQRGFVTGPFKWLDSYINQIWLNNQMQIALLTLAGNANSIPFDSAGAGLLRQALADPIAAGLAFGAFGPGSISAAQAAEVNAAAGQTISNTLQAQGYYVQIVPAASAVRSARGPQQINFWYLDRGSVQVINVSSVAVP